MAWQYRKRVKIAPGLYMNINKNGINASVGVRGASITFGKNGSYLNTGIPGTGVYSRHRIGKPCEFSGGNEIPSYASRIPSKATYTFTAAFCALMALACISVAPIWLIGTFGFGMGLWNNLYKRKKYYGTSHIESVNEPSYLTEAKEALTQATDERQKRILSHFITTIEAIDSIEDIENILKVLNKKPTKNAELIRTHSATLTSLKVQLDSTKYDIDATVTSEVMDLYEEMCQSFEQLLTSQKIWIQTSKYQNVEIKSSASAVVSIKETKFEVGVFNYIHSKFDVPVIPVGEQLLYLYPEYAILSTSPSRFEIIDYSNISLKYSSIRFNEPGVYPADAVKIGTTWEYVNKDGKPDRRYSNNRQISVVRYGGMILTIKGKRTITFQISNAQLSEKFCSSFNVLVERVRMDCKTSEASIIHPIDAIPHLDSETKFSRIKVFQVADTLYQCLIDMSNDCQVIEALDNQRELETLLKLKKISNVIDKRLAVVALADLVKCFDRLGHAPNMATDEGWTIGIVLARILLPDNMVGKNPSWVQQAEGQKILEDCYRIVKDCFPIKDESDKFVLLEILKHEEVEEEIINKWAILLYRYALIIANADGYLSEVEQKWLTNILSFTNRAADINPSEKPSKKIFLPSGLDPLFAEVARYVVLSNIGSVSSLQRYFSIGYNRAGKIMDQLEMVGIVGPAYGGRPRKVIMDSLTLEDLLNSGADGVDNMPNISSSSEKKQGADKPKKVRSRIISNPMKELEKLIGLERVKTEISSIYNLIKIQQVRQEKGLTVPQLSYHCVFTGNPGTGKTTVARLIAEIYKNLGILSKGHLVETDRSGLVAEYVGQTAVKTNKIIDSAIDGVLFIDEAYSLVQNGGDKDYGLEAISTLLKRMEDDCDRLVVILAGYSAEMKQFIDSNPGLQSRFNRYINFEDYSADELVSIFEHNLSKFDYKMTSEASEAIKTVMDKAVANKDNNFGNARFVRNLFEKTIERQAKRLAASSLSSMTEEMLVKITKEDIPLEEEATDK